MTAELPKHHKNWVDYFIQHLNVLKPLDIEVERFLGCGEIGCAFSVKGGRILKVTTDKQEAATWDIIAEEQKLNPTAMKGIATVYRRPFGMWMPKVQKKYLYGILREGLMSVKQSDKLYYGIKQIGRADPERHPDEGGPKFPGDPEPLEELEEMVKAVPETRWMAASIHHLYIRTGGIYFLGDLHTDNVGRRKNEKWLILRDPGWAETPTRGKEFKLWKPQGYVVYP